MHKVVHVRLEVGVGESFIINDQYVFKQLMTLWSCPGPIGSVCNRVNEKKDHKKLMTPLLAW